MELNARSQGFKQHSGAPGAASILTSGLQQFFHQRLALPAPAQNGSIAADNAHVLCGRQYRAGSGNARLTVHDMLGEQIHPRPQVLRPTIFWMNIQFTSTFDGRSNIRKKMLSSRRGFVVFSQQNHQFMFKPRSAACLAILWDRAPH